MCWGSFLVGVGVCFAISFFIGMVVGVLLLRGAIGPRF